MDAIKANIISLFLALNATDQKEVLAKLKTLANKDTQQGGKNISEEKL